MLSFTYSSNLKPSLTFHASHNVPPPIFGQVSSSDILHEGEIPRHSFLSAITRISMRLSFLTYPSITWKMVLKMAFPITNTNSLYSFQYLCQSKTNVKGLL